MGDACSDHTDRPDGMAEGHRDQGGELEAQESEKVSRSLQVDDGAGMGPSFPPEHLEEQSRGSRDEQQLRTAPWLGRETRQDISGCRRVSRYLPGITWSPSGYSGYMEMS